MIRNIGDDASFTNRTSHSNDVEKTCCSIVDEKDLKELVNLERLKISALLHDIGHTPFGHAGEDIINSLFCSIDNIHYSESNPGLFKHNLNSVRLLTLDKSFTDLGEDKYIIMDSILKHSSLMPSNYNFILYSDENILKINYIFFKIDFEKSDLMKAFWDCYKDNKCNSRNNLIVNRKICHLCAGDRKICYFADKVIDERHKLSSYLSYPYALTIEGTVLYWADEISCFISDLKDALIFLHKYEKDVKRLISMNMIKSELALIETELGNSFFLNKMKEYVDLVDCIDMSLDRKIEKGNFLLNELKKYLINSLDIKDLDKSFVAIKTVNGKCEPRFSLPVNTLKMLARVKKGIYKDIHDIQYIKKTNQVGKNIINSLLMFYCRNFDAFLTDYCQINRVEKKIFSEELAEAVCNLLSISTRPAEGWTKNPYVFQLAKEIGSESFSPTDEYLREIVLIKKNIKDESKEYNRIVNLFKREIGYFIASLNEKQLLKLEEKRETNRLIKELPTKYVFE